MAKKQGLGRGLRSLISEEALNMAEVPVKIDPETDQYVIEMDLNKIRPNEGQPRKNFDKEALKELAKSIEAYGVLQPIVVQPAGEGYTIIAGERRFKAAKLAGLVTIPVIIRDLDPQKIMEIAIVENVQRKDLNPMEEAMAYEQLMLNFGMTQNALSERIGKSRSSIANTLRLLNLPTEVRQLLLDDEITEGHARALLTLSEPAMISEVANMIREADLSVRETEKLCKNRNLSLKKTKTRNISIPAAEKSPYLLDCEMELNGYFSTKCMVNGNEKKGAFVITYDSAEAYNRIYDLLLQKGENQ